MSILQVAKPPTGGVPFSTLDVGTTFTSLDGGLFLKVVNANHGQGDDKYVAVILEPRRHGTGAFQLTKWGAELVFPVKARLELLP